MAKRKNLKRKNNGNSRLLKQNLAGPYLNTLTQINFKTSDVEECCKTLMRAIYQKINNCKNLKLLKSKDFPMLIFQYQQKSSYFPIGFNRHIRDIFFLVPNLRKKRQEFKQIFDKLFIVVPKKYQNLAEYGLIKAEQSKVNMIKQDLINKENYMFYYTKTLFKINFTIFDKGLRCIQFDSNLIQQHKYREQYKLYERFIKEINKIQQNKQTINDIFNKQERESDQEDHEHFKKKTKQEILKNIKELQNKTFSKFNQNDEEQSDQQIQQQNDITERLQKIQNRMKHIEYFQKIKNQIRNSLSSIKILNQTQLMNQLRKLTVSSQQIQNNLPIIQKKFEIFQQLNKNNILIIEGETGSGKSTQLPQMLAQFYKLFDSQDSLPILVTQPRRLATRSLAERVARQMNETVGGFVDYVATAGKQVSKQSKILFKLDRIVLDELTSDKFLQKYSCLIIDEAHQRTISIDVILGLVNDLLKKRKGSNFKVIISSATMDLPLFQKYFDVKPFKVAGRIYPIQLRYMDYSINTQGDKNETIKRIQKIIDQQILTYDLKNKFKGHILCFCSGLEQINYLTRLYLKKLHKKPFLIYALHGKISPKDQKKVFKDTQKTKIIFASRIAETAITIDKVNVVIDPGYDIELIYDKKNKISSMKLQQISQSSAKQRAGRAGRTSQGYCFRLYSRQSFIKRRINNFPEMQNSSLETVVLRLKALGIQDILKFKFLYQPHIIDLRQSLELLKIVGTISNNKITKIGELISKFPIDPILSRAIIEAMIFDKLFKNNEILDKMELQCKKQYFNSNQSIKSSIICLLATIIHYMNLFITNNNQKQNMEFRKYQEFTNSNETLEGDFFFLQKIYTEYLKNRNKQSKDKNILNNWIYQNYLNQRTLIQIDQLISQIQYIVKEFNIDGEEMKQQINIVAQKLIKCKSIQQIYLSCLVTSFCSNLCKYSGRTQIGYTILGTKKPIKIDSSSSLSLLGVQPNWIIAYDFNSNQFGNSYCKIAHGIEYEFLKTHVSKSVWDNYKIQKIQKENPFYEIVKYSLPTKMIYQIKSDYVRGERQNIFSFLREGTPILDEKKNQLLYFFCSDENIQKYQRSKKQIDEYINGLKQKSHTKYNYKYIDYVYAHISDGLQVQQVYFPKKQYCIEITSLQGIANVISQNSVYFGRFVFDNSGVNKKYKKIKVFIVNQSSKNQFMSFLFILKQTFGQDIQIKQSIQNRRVSNSSKKLKLTFYAGQPSRQNIYLGYQNKNICYRMFGLIKNAIIIAPLCKINTHKLKPSKNKKGMNFYDCCYDEYEIQDQLFRLYYNGYLDKKQFQFPLSINKFRNPSQYHAYKTDAQWIQQITRLISRLNQKDQNLTIQIHGTYDAPYSIRKMYKNPRVNMNAQIITTNHKLIQQFTKEYNDRKVLGTGKLHAKNYFEQNLAIINRSTMNALQTNFQNLRDELQEKYEGLQIYWKKKNIKNIPKSIIIGQSQKPQVFTHCKRAMQKLFNSNILRLNLTQYKILQNAEIGKRILWDIQQKYDYKVYFEFDSRYNVIYIYGNEVNKSTIQVEIYKRIGSIRILEQTVSYVGKNLNKVRQILQNNRYACKGQEFVEYQFKMLSRQIKITATISKFQQIINQINHLNQDIILQCKICEGVMNSPYKLINCQCTFCWCCLIVHIDYFKSSGQDIIYCPDNNCCQKKVKINILDLKTLLSEEQFNKLCDLKIKKYSQKHLEKYYSCYNCQNILDREELQKNKQLACQICGYSRCEKCGAQRHPGFTCEQWQRQNQIETHIVKLGIKQCPKCRVGIQKTQGCNHMHCKSCQTHICWKCLKHFQTKDQCYDHLGKVCGGIFDQL